MLKKQKYFNVSLDWLQIWIELWPNGFLLPQICYFLEMGTGMKIVSSLFGVSGIRTLNLSFRSTAPSWRHSKQFLPSHATELGSGRWSSFSRAKVRIPPSKTPMTPSLVVSWPPSPGRPTSVASSRSPLGYSGWSTGELILLITFCKLCVEH